MNEGSLYVGSWISTQDPNARRHPSVDSRRQMADGRRVELRKLNAGGTGSDLKLNPQRRRSMAVVVKESKHLSGSPPYRGSGKEAKNCRVEPLMR